MKLLPRDTSVGCTSIVHVPIVWVSIDYGHSNLETLLWRFEQDLIFALGVSPRRLFNV